MHGEAEVRPIPTSDKAGQEYYVIVHVIQCNDQKLFHPVKRKIQRH